MRAALTLALLLMASPAAADLSPWLAQDEVPFIERAGALYVIVTPHASEKPEAVTYKALADEAVCHLLAIGSTQTLRLPVVVAFVPGLLTSLRVLPLGEPLAVETVTDCPETA